MGIFDWEEKTEQLLSDEWFRENGFHRSFMRTTPAGPTIDCWAYDKTTLQNGVPVATWTICIYDVATGKVEYRINNPDWGRTNRPNGSYVIDNRRYIWKVAYPKTVGDFICILGVLN